MSNTLLNISEVPFDTFLCEKKVHFGFVWALVAMSLSFFLGAPAHSWCLWLFLHSGWKIKPTQVFPLSLTALDLLFCIHLLIEMLNRSVFLNTTAEWVLLFFFGLFWICRLLIQVCICIEQYLAVLHPVTFLRYKSVRYRTASVVTAWLLSLGYGLLMVCEVILFPDFIFLSSCIFGLTVISFCCVSVLYELKHPGPGGREVAKERVRDVGNQQKRAAFKIISMVLLNILLSYIPLASIGIFCFIQTGYELLYCEIIPTLLTPIMYCVMYPPLLKLYKEGHLKCISNQWRNQIR